tara:strand:- start:189 stop:536 length:348 start_codon:yes stop_codon:yes gene_type:complete
MSGELDIEQITETLGNSRYFYGLRRTSEGELFISKVDLLELKDGVQVNRPGAVSDNFNDFSRGVDFFDGRDGQHRKNYKNLVYEQYKWDGRNIFYYVNTDGELVLRINEQYTYEA